MFNTLDIATSIPLYDVALNDGELREWTDGDDETLGLYIQFKLMLAYAYLEDERFLTTYQTIVAAFPDPATRPVYAALADTFWNAMQVTNNLHSACLEVRDIIEQRPEALGRLNSYGSRSPLYTAENLCPF
ncbi:MAG: hypothetical protein H7175_27030 [Burkholderiales bacterium]|nr:hypothetical protein [Anaerolineae bacterium]